MHSHHATSVDETHNFAGVSVHAGFPNPAAESPLENPNFNKLLIRHPAATYCMTVSGHEWEDRGIFHGDIIVIDRSLTARRNDLVIWWQDDSFIIGSLQSLTAAEHIWGRVTAVIHQF